MRKQRIKGDSSDMLMKPKIDFAFKLLFGSDNEKSKALLINLLNSVLGLKDSRKITRIVHLDPYINQEYKGDKMSIMDVGVRTDSGELIDMKCKSATLMITVKGPYTIGQNCMQETWKKGSLMSNLKNALSSA